MQHLWLLCEDMLLWLLLPSYISISWFFQCASSILFFAYETNFIVNSVLDISIAYLKKKRKLQDELLGMPSPKHVCWGQRLVYDFPSDSTIEPKMVRGSIFERGVESKPESASHSYSFPSDADLSMSSHDGAKTYLSYPKADASAEPVNSSTFSNDTSSQIDPYSSESRSQTKSSSSKFESPSICEELHCLYREYGLHLSDTCEDHLLEFGSYGNCSLSGCQNDATEGCVDESVDNQLYSNGAAGNSYVLSSGRWSVNQDSQEGTRKLTIDKEFEQYFSALML
ncbi:far-red-elongated hypocotyl1-like protein [Perilla frutescens var. hirtella]|uniref:Far-red-elongated hypocotyl1-like protein n=1 Tax=Perilla frutescens var. hirtella TaxID=608512 RepID=A0AAD4J966_PERFH|nr:far-red-elongated hypocotyl1-like protein [Perilla frutescens var. hirtella]KAH6806215.1 far-red-elongated hypocotyl1-like protein [Perilla frutescens var. frutescens]KAH6829502.1 far-red-elongated hypocotyl1-like protein [Perilla frutescens var. hirtella]